MAMAARQLEDQATPDEGVNFEELAQTMAMRKKIEGLVNDQDWQQFLSKKTILQYREYLAAQTGLPPANDAHYGDQPRADSLEGLQQMHQYMLREWQKAKGLFSRVNALLTGMMAEKIGSQKDHDFLVRWMLGGEYDFTEENASKFEQVIRKKTERMRHDKKRFERLSKHPLIKHPSVLRAISDGKIKPSDNHSFLEASVPERRSFLDGLEDAILAQEAIEALESKEIQKSVDLYQRRLKIYLSQSSGQGCMGKVTFQQFMDEFEEMAEAKNFEGMKKWHAEFSSEIKPREQLWRAIRSTLKGEGRARMEAKMHVYGFSKMKVYFEHVKQAESERLCKSYSEALNVKRGLWYGQHTADEFEAWMESQPLEGKYTAEFRLSAQLERYRLLWNEIGYLLPEQFQFMKNKLNDKAWGYSEFETQLKTFQAENVVNPSAPELMLNQIADGAKREAIRKLGNGLSQVNLEAMVGVVGRMLEFSGQVLEQDFEAVIESQVETFQGDDLVESPVQNLPTPSFKNEIESDVDLEADIEDLAKNQRAEVIQMSEFRQVRHSGAKKMQRVAEVVLNQKDSLDQFFGEHRRKAFLSGSSSVDHLTMQVDVGGQSRLLARPDLMVLRNYLKLRQAS